MVLHHDSPTKPNQKDDDSFWMGRPDLTHRNHVKDLVAPLSPRTKAQVDGAMMSREDLRGLKLFQPSGSNRTDKVVSDFIKLAPAKATA